jgi:hypothetical protein
MGETDGVKIENECMFGYNETIKKQRGMIMERMNVDFTPVEGKVITEGTNQEKIVVEGTVNGEDALITIHPYALDQETADFIVANEGFDYPTDEESGEYTILSINEYPETIAPGE